MQNFQKVSSWAPLQFLKGLLAGGGGGSSSDASKESALPQDPVDDRIDTTLDHNLDGGVVPETHSDHDAAQSGDDQHGDAPAPFPGDCDAYMDPQAPEEPALAPLALEPVSFVRPSPTYIPTVIKEVKVVKRSQLREQLRQKTQPAVPGVRVPLDVKPKSAAARSSRGSRLLGMAAVGAQQAAKPVEEPCGFGGDLTSLPPEDPPLQDADPFTLAAEASHLSEGELLQNPVEPAEYVADAAALEEAGLNTTTVVETPPIEAAPALPSPEVAPESEEEVDAGGEGQHATQQQTRLTESPCKFTSTEDGRVASTEAAIDVPGDVPEEDAVDGMDMEVEVASAAPAVEEAVSPELMDAPPLETGETGVQPSDGGSDSPDDDASRLLSPLIGISTDLASGAKAPGPKPRLSGAFTPLPSLLPFDASFDDDNPFLSPIKVSWPAIGTTPAAAADVLEVCPGLGLSGMAAAGATPQVQFPAVAGEATAPAATGPNPGETSSRRVRFAGLEAEDERKQETPLKGSSSSRPTRSSSRPRRSSGGNNAPAAKPAVVVPPPRFGIGAFVRFTRSQAQGVPEDAEGFAGQDSGAVVITRRMHCYSTGQARRGCLLQPQPQPPSSPGHDAVPQQLREAFLNARLAECWGQGESWARLDLAGIEVNLAVNQAAELEATAAQMTAQHGQAALAAALEQLNVEWGHLRSVRLRYVGSPAIAMAPNAAPRSILKHKSGIAASPPAAQEATPPEAAIDLSAPGFDSIMAAEIVPGSGSAERRCHGPAPWLDGLHAERIIGAPDLTAGLALSRGIKMLASLQQGPTPVGNGATPAASAVPCFLDTARPTQQSTPAGVTGSRGAKQPLEPGSGERARRRVEKSHMVRSRGQRLLQALQQAAGGELPSAAAAARLIVDGPGAGGLEEESPVEADDMVAGCSLATTFISS